MEYMFDCARLPQNRQLLKDINEAATRLAQKLASLQPAELGISELSQKVLSEKQEYLTAHLQIFTFVAAWSLNTLDKPYQQAALLECGGGIGLLSLLAKELGIGTVVYSDIYDVVRQDAEILAAKLNLVAEHYVEGDIDEVIDFSNSNNITYDAIGSYDVIEHVYDIDVFLSKFNQFQGNPLSLAMASGANMYNRGYNKWITEFQRQCESEGRKADFGHYERDTLRPYIDIRKDMIKNKDHTSSLSEDEVDQLATHTRGMRQDDIEKAVQTYLDSKKLPPLLKHPTNTCDPYTGNWQEHLMNPSDLTKVLQQAGFKADWLSGYRSGRYASNPLKRLAGLGVNVAIKTLNKSAVQLSPFYTLYAARD